MNCRINRRRQWTARILLEARLSSASSFLTLTYDDDSLPMVQGADGAPVPTLRPTDLQLFLKRLRNHVRFRFFAVGEYGSRTWRPHYHAILFSIDPMHLGREIGTDVPGGKTDLWGHGHISISDLNAARAAYCAHYTTKKMMRAEDERLQGDQYPEFSRMSLRPGIGAPAIPYLAKLHRTNGGKRLYQQTGDISNTVRINSKIWPLDEYMRTLLREHLNIPIKAEDRELPPPELGQTQKDLLTAQGHYGRVLRLSSKLHGVV